MNATKWMAHLKRYEEGVGRESVWMSRSTGNPALEVVFVALIRLAPPDDRSAPSVLGLEHLVA